MLGFTRNILGSRTLQLILVFCLSSSYLFFKTLFPFLLYYLKPRSATSVCLTASFGWLRLIWIRKTCIPHFLLLYHQINYIERLVLASLSIELNTALFFFLIHLSGDLMYLSHLKGKQTQLTDVTFHQNRFFT
jgi:hypothetical protein